MPIFETVELHGVRMEMDPAIISEKLRVALRNKSYEAAEVKQLTRIIAPGERILELGGGLGLVSTIAARHPDTEAVRVFEANPALRPYIERVHRMNDIVGVDVVTGILTHDTRQPFVPFYIRRDIWASSLTPGKGFRKMASVAVHSFHTELKRFRPTMIVCDIEGGEEELLADAQLDGVAKVLVEVHERIIGAAGVKRLIDHLAQQGLVQDIAHSQGKVLLFRRMAAQAPVNPGAGTTQVH